MQELMSHREFKGLVFMSPYVDEPFEFRKQWYKARDNTDIDKSFVFHSLRHTAASNLAKAGQSLLQIGVILGHKSTQTTLRYSHLVERNTLYDITHEAMAHLG